MEEIEYACVDLEKRLAESVLLFFVIPITGLLLIFGITSRLFLLGVLVFEIILLVLMLFDVVLCKNSNGVYMHRRCGLSCCFCCGYDRDYVNEESDLEDWEK